jgi:membrane protein YqaA with SNARE-associated domain
MNPTHVHVFITHLPIFGSILGALVLTLSLVTRNRQTLFAAYLVLIISSAGGGVAYITGEEAEETVEKIQGIDEKRIEEHEEAAKFAMITSIGLGVLSILGMIIQSRRSSYQKGYAIFVLIVALFTFSVVVRTGFLGGYIRHTEIHKTS